LVQKKKPSEDGNVIKECLVVAGDSLLMDLKIKLKYAMKLRRSSYLEVLSLEEWNVCLMTMNNK
jgi:hypothetical protein